MTKFNRPGRRPRPGAGREDHGLGVCTGPECEIKPSSPPGKGCGKGEKGKGIGQDTSREYPKKNKRDKKN